MKGNTLEILSPLPILDSPSHITSFSSQVHCTLFFIPQKEALISKDEACLHSVKPVLTRF